MRNDELLQKVAEILVAAPEFQEWVQRNAARFLVQAKDGSFHVCSQEERGTR